MSDNRIENLEKEVENIDFSAIGAKLCGKPLTKEQQDEVEKLHNAYKEMEDIKIHS